MKSFTRFPALFLPVLFSFCSSASARDLAEDLPRKLIRSSEWARETLIYEVYLRSFSEEGKFHRLEANLPQIKKLGAAGLCLLPIYPQGESGRKGYWGNPYSIKDFHGVSLEYGTKDGFKNLIQEAHLLGLKVILDWPAYGTARDHPFMKSNPEWYLKESSASVLSSESGGEIILLDYRNENAGKAMIQAMAHWVAEYQIDGFRFSGADRVPMDFWREAARELKGERANLLLMADGEDPQYHALGFDLTAFRSFYETLADVAAGRSDVQKLEEVLDREKARFPQDALRLLYLEDHATQRAAKVFGPALEACSLLIYTLEGVPALYNGQEIAQADPLPLDDKKTIPWKEGGKKFSRLKNFYKTLGKLRAEHVSLSHGQRFRIPTSDDRKVLAFARSYRGDAVLAVVNLSAGEFKGTLDLPEICVSEKGDLKLKAVFPGGDLRPLDHSKAELLLPPWGYQIWEVK